MTTSSAADSQLPSPSPPSPPPLPGARPRAAAPGRIVIPALFLTWLADFLFWGYRPGVSFALFGVALSVSLVLCRPRRSFSALAIGGFVLLLLTAGQTAVEISFSNVIVTLGLLLVLFAETSYPALRDEWARISESFVALLKAPAQWFWLRSVFLEMRRSESSRGDHARLGVLVAARRAIRVALPALCLSVVFAMLLGSGNAIFGQWISRMFGEVIRWIAAWTDLSPARVFFWLFILTLVLVWLRPAPAPGTLRIWTRPIPRLPAPRAPQVARWQSIGILAALNALFFAVNTIDAFYLWARAGVTAPLLPEGVSYSRFVHEGVWSLIAAVLLSAAVLAGLFQQSREVSGARVVKALALAWIAQNVVLILGVLLRLKLYVDACQLTALRVYVACFLGLVAAGFSLLAVFIVRERSLGWLIGSNAVATFCLFFLVQFGDVAGWVAEHNVSRWLREPGRTLDVAYLKSLGPSAWPELVRVAQSSERPESWQAWNEVKTLKAAQKAYLDGLDWRSWQWRRVTESRRLVAAPTHGS